MVHINPLQFDSRVLDMPHLACVVRSGMGGCRRWGGSSSASHADDEEMLPLLQNLLAEFVSLSSSSPPQLTCCRNVHENFSTHPLPDIVRCHQHEALLSMNGACEAMLHAARRMSFCLVCAINGGL